MAKKYNVGVNIGWCKGCCLCVNACPKSVLEMNERMKPVPIRADDCIGCRQCDNICPELTITITDRAGGEVNSNGK